MGENKKLDKLSPSEIETFEQANFERLVRELGYDMAVFVFCAYKNIKYNPDIEEVERWKDYKEKIHNDGEEIKFRHGLTDVNEVINIGMTEEERWLLDWGEGDTKKPYTEKDYRRLDELYRTMGSRLMKGGGMDEQQEHTIRSCCTMSLLAEKNIAKGDKESIDVATKLNKMIQDNLSSENLRKKDEKPIETMKVDGIVEAVKRKYGVGVELTYEQAIEICSKWLIGHHYPMTRDAAEEMLLSIINCTRQNNDDAILSEIPQGQGFSIECTEFADTPNLSEIETYDYLGIKRKGGDE